MEIHMMLSFHCQQLYSAIHWR